MNEKEKKALRVLFILNKQTEADLARDGIPPTRQELEIAGVNKKQLRSLENLGVCSSHVVEVNDNVSKNSTGRTVYRMSMLGYELCRQLGFKAPSQS